ncbi:hypothetical protein ACOT81_13110 [Streptomyces sp. WI04-05B]|uniref:hypothetical protein n=1 Tax=Streptomyces TaxID=1883 RepID=UPI0029A4D8A3|nr:MULTISPECIES: hypothetical protein [unclassified Streptomyces]MDX2545380.1 hypothetical protein [Streptomyces sp. WI04-05B]MDX2588125.1 hypothetical protein [Streptomyces sp. WI04-05A]MDX3749114.1 hypothetical protein [Streptomyces sp. AK08-02]
MIPISAADEELYSAVIVASRLGRAKAIVRRMTERYEKEWADPLAGFPYALSMLAVLQSGAEDALEQLDYAEIVETLGDLLYTTPDHWLGRFLRIHARMLLPTDATEHRNYIASERAKAAEDTEDLLERQGRARWQPWFACTHLLAARLAWETDPADTDRLAATVSAAAARTTEPVPFRSLGSVMCDPFLWYYRESGLPARDTVAAMATTLFPDQPSVRNLRAEVSG